MQDKDKQFSLYTGDIPSEVYQNSKSIAIDTETTGLILHRDRICLVQLCDERGVASIIKVTDDTPKTLIEILLNPNIQKIFHFARFDLSMMMCQFNLLSSDQNVQNVYCTKVASKLTRTYTERHGLKTLCLELVGANLDKAQQRTDWASENLTKEQLEYAIYDVIYLHEIRDILNKRLKREKKLGISEECFKSIITISILDVMCFRADIFDH